MRPEPPPSYDRISHPEEHPYALDAHALIHGPYHINTVIPSVTNIRNEPRNFISSISSEMSGVPTVPMIPSRIPEQLLVSGSDGYRYQHSDPTFYSAPVPPDVVNMMPFKDTKKYPEKDPKQTGDEGVELPNKQEDEQPAEGATAGDEVEIRYSKKAHREMWDTKIDFLLSVIGFAVDLGNIWRFPYVCYRNGGGAFLIPYLVMYIFGGLPLFYLELALGQFQRSGCLTVWKRICPMFSGIGFGICIIASYTAWYYNTIMAWALFYLFDAMKPHLPWDSCNNWWNTNSCVTIYQKLVNHTLIEDEAEGGKIYTNASFLGGANISYFSSTEEYFYRRVLQLQYSTGYNNVGPVRWEIALCLMAVFTIVYFSLWKGVKSSGKAVWVTATMPYVILSILLVRGLTLEGSLTGIKYYLTPRFSSLLKISVWSDAASQIFFSLGPGFGVLLALSSYNKFHNNCYSDAMITSFINCATSFISGFVVFSVLGHMCFRMNKTMEDVANEGPGLVFIAYPEAIATLKGSTFWAIIFMLMLITLGLDSTFAGLEAIITAVLDRIPNLRRRRELFVLFIIIYCFLGALATTTCGGFLILELLDQHGAPISILFIVFCECVALCWFYGTKRFCGDVKQMLGFTPGKFWQICWTFISPLFLLSIFIANLANYTFRPTTALGITYQPDTWVIVVAWMVVFSSVVFIPIMMFVQFVTAKGSTKARLRYLITPEDKPTYSDQKQLKVPDSSHPANDTTEKEIEPLQTQDP
uniref:Transporter n=1 Tax=Cryptocotyle lingua TaxID=66766 RepID=A0A7U0YEV4_9TREM|nr:sodium-dependent serotonin transporter [Cryptocotyle lingua]